MDEKFERYTDTMNPLLEEAIACTPENWTKGTLTIECDGSWMGYRLKNDDEPGTASISEKLRRLCEEFYTVMRQGGDVWTRAFIDFKEKDDESWGFNLRFEYPDGED